MKLKNYHILTLLQLNNNEFFNFLYSLFYFRKVLNLHFYGRNTDYRLIGKLNPDKTFPTPIKSGLTMVGCR